MQLRTARLCLDCEEIHDAQQCPVCASEIFAYISRWVPAPERRAGPRPQQPSDAAAVRSSRTASPPSRGGRLLKGSVVGLTAVGLAGWFFGRRPGPSNEPKPR